MKALAYKTAPRTDLKLTALGMGCSTIGSLYRAATEDESRETLRTAWDLGIRYYDVAPFYGFTLAEHRTGTALREHPRNEFVLSTKVGRLMRPDASVRPGECDWAHPLPFRPQYDYSYSGILRSHEDSLQRLGTHRVDILFVHDIGRMTHGDMHEKYWEELTRGGGFRALEELRANGQIKAFGLGVNEWEVVADAMQEADLDLTLLAGRYTLLEQQTLPFLDECRRRGHAIVLGGPFNSGILAGNDKFNYGAAPADVVARVKALKAACAEFGVPLPAAALQFPMAHPMVVSCVPGGRAATQLRQNFEWFEMPIPTELWSTLKQRGLLAENAPTPAGD